MEHLRKLFLLLFFGSVSVLATFLLRNFILPMLAPVVFVALTVWIADIIKKYGKAVGVLAAFLYIFFTFLTLNINYFPTILISVAMFSFPFFYNFEVEGRELKAILKEMGVSRKNFLRNAAVGVAVAVFVLLPLIIIEALLILHFKLEEPGRVADIAKELPLYILIFSFTFTPIAEEVCFRGFLLQRVGVFISTLLFALAHFFYGSLIEFAATFTAGLLFALMRRRDSLIQPIFAHAAFNFINAVVIIFYVRA
ncbi:MAG: type II CAAX endopeptidase family protein [Candidatus Micrarchaeia archaeon]